MEIFSSFFKNQERDWQSVAVTQQAHYRGSTGARPNLAISSTHGGPA